MMNDDKEQIRQRPTTLVPCCVDKGVKIKLMGETRLPTRATFGSAGYDVYAPFDFSLQPNEQKRVPMGFSMEMASAEFFCKIYPRSGLLNTQQLDVRGGVIDSDYRGEISIVFKNESANVVVVEKHDRCAQLVFIKLQPVRVEEWQGELGCTSRSLLGFGSTGK